MRTATEPDLAAGGVDSNEGTAILYGMMQRKREAIFPRTFEHISMQDGKEATRRRTVHIDAGVYTNIDIDIDIDTNTDLDIDTDIDTEINIYIYVYTYTYIYI